jgi:DNA-binding transcriptional MerR regulator
MNTSSLTTPLYTQPVVLAVTGLKPAQLQTWVNREVVLLCEQNPGYGRRRLYSALDIIKFAIMRRLAGLQIDLSVSRTIIEDTERTIDQCGKVDWDLYLTLRLRDPEASVQIVGSSNMRFLGFAPMIGDPRNVRLSTLTEPFEDTGIWSRRRKPTMEQTLSGDDERPIDPQRREVLAAKGMHAEPVIIFPLGEIVNGTLAQLHALGSPTE